MKFSANIRPIAAAAAISALTFASTAASASQPTYAARSGETVHGTIASLSGNDVYVRDDRGFVDHIVLDDRTAIQPAGADLSTGETVTISGETAGSILRASEVDANAPEDDASQDDSIDDSGSYAVPYGDYGYPVYGGITIGGGFFGGGYHGNYGGGNAHERILLSRAPGKH